MPSLKRLDAQGGSISHGQPNNEEGEEDIERLLVQGCGGAEELLVSFNLSDPHTL